MPCCATRASGSVLFWHFQSCHITLCCVFNSSISTVKTWWGVKKNQWSVLKQMTCSCSCRWFMIQHMGATGGEGKHLMLEIVIIARKHFCSCRLLWGVIFPLCYTFLHTLPFITFLYFTLCLTEPPCLPPINPALLFLSLFSHQTLAIRGICSQISTCLVPNWLKEICGGVEPKEQRRLHLEDLMTPRCYISYCISVARCHPITG